MYSFFIKSAKTNLDTVIVRAIFAIAATAAFVESQEYGIIGIIVGAVLAVASIFINTIKQKLKISSLILLIIGIALLCLITRSPYFILVLILHWLLEKFVHKETRIDIDNTGLTMSKPLNNKKYSWKDIQHIVLKDGLLTVDLVSNHYMQSEVRGINGEIDEISFNQFCKTQNKL